MIEAKTLDPALDLRNHEVFDRTLFTRDDQLLQQLNAGIDFGQPLPPIEQLLDWRA